MNLVFIAPFAYSPKATVSARMVPIAQALIQCGHHVSILMPPYDKPGYSGQKWSADGIEFENMRVHTHWPPALNMASLALQLTRRTTVLQPDAIHIFKPVGPGALAMQLLFSFGYHMPILDNDDWEGAGGWLDVNPYPALQKRYMAWQERWCLSHAIAVTCASHVLARRSVELGCPSKAVTVFPNGPQQTMKKHIDDALQTRDELRLKFGWNDKRVLIYTGTVPLNHDLDIAVHAVGSIRYLFPHLRWVIIASGEGVNSLKGMVAQAGLDDVAEYHEFMPHDQLVERLVAADIALYPYRDTNINQAKCAGKVVDYLACGVPSVVSRVGMNTTYIDSDDVGLLTEPGNPVAFRDALLRLLNAPGEARNIGCAGQQRIWREFGWDNRINELLSIYRSVSP